MRIKFVSQYFYPEPFSNTNVAAELVRRGHHVSVLTAVPNYATGEFADGYSNRQRRCEDWEGIPVERVYTVPRGKRKLSLVVNFLAFALFGAMRAWREPRGAQDVVFVSLLSPIFMAIPAIVIARRLKIPLVYWVQDIWPESATFTLGMKNPLLTTPLAWACGWIYRRADLILVQSAAFPRRIERFGVPPERIRIFPNTAPELYRPLAALEAPEEAMLVPQEGFRLMFAGNIGASQDFDTLMAAAERLRHRRELKWVIVGTGRDMERIQVEIARRNLKGRFEFLGRFPEDRMPRFFAHADAVLVSLKDAPIFALTVPYKVQCYMACGKPIIASLDGEGARIIEESGSGLTSPACAPNQLAAAIEMMIDMPAKARATMGARARAYFDHHYRAEKVYGDLERWLIEITRRKAD